ncbi:thiamine phosphate synthase, partial [Klebsiella pneumoniae]|uniref:thiamine phosphate synthase n=1 Tax=Klebsiella pneumoniae TaxID=573 RepID=UPI0028E12216
DSEVEDDVIAAIALGRRYHARLFINDYWQLAIKHQAYGVHLGIGQLDAACSVSIIPAPLRVSSAEVAEILRRESSVRDVILAA